MKYLISLVAVLSVAALTLGAMQGSKSVLLAMLSGSGKGRAVWKTDDRAGRFRAEVQVEAQGLVPGAEYVVTAGDSEWHTFANVFGQVRINQRYLTLLRPAIVPGSKAAITDSSGAIVMAGTFLP